MEKYLLAMDIGLTGFFTILKINNDYLEIVDSRQFIVEEKSQYVLSKSKSKSTIKNQINVKDNLKVIEDIIIKNNIKNIVGLIEQVTPRFNHANASILSLGDTNGASRAMLDVLNIKYKVIAPKSWKTSLSLTSEKQESINLIQELIKAKRIICKNNKKYTNHNQVESILIAYYFFSEILKK